MFTIDDLSRKIADYRVGRISFEQLDEWFEDNSYGAYAVPDPELREAYMNVDAAIGRYYFDRMGEHALRAELANAVRPFVPCAESAGGEIRIETYRLPEQWVQEPVALVRWLGKAVGEPTPGAVAASSRIVVQSDSSWGSTSAAIQELSVQLV